VIEEVKVNPAVRAAALGTAQHASVKLARQIQISHVKRKVKKAFHGVSLSGSERTLQSFHLLLSEELVAPIVIKE
jgi:hypothetical protein